MSSGSCDKANDIRTLATTCRQDLSGLSTCQRNAHSVRAGVQKERANLPKETFSSAKILADVGFGEDLGQGQVLVLSKRSKGIAKVEILVVIQIR